MALEAIKGEVKILQMDGQTDGRTNGRRTTMIKKAYLNLRFR